jgi:hypothetical protein
MEKVINSRDAFRHSVNLRLTVGVFASCGTPLGILYANGNDAAPVDLTVQGTGDEVRAVALTQDGETFLAMCPIE